MRAIEYTRDQLNATGRATAQRAIAEAIAALEAMDELVGVASARIEQRALEDALTLLNAASMRLQHADRAARKRVKTNAH